MNVITTILAVAAADAPLNEFGFLDGGPEQDRMDFLASAFDGLTLLPFVLLFVWGMNRLKLNRWVAVTAALATVLAVVVFGLMHEFVIPIFLYNDQVLEMIGVYRFRYVLIPALTVCFYGGLALAWSLKRRQRLREPECSSETLK